MNEQEILFSHPHDHFSFRHITVIPNTCFVLMPFDERLTIVYETIGKALKGLMVCTRADDLPIGKPILERILTGIRSAELIIADLTGRNANVFYELGLAHTQTKNVLLLTQDINDVPFDLRGLFCHTYSAHSAQGLKRLADVVRSAAAEVRAKSVPTMIKGALARTKQIVAYMEQSLASPRRLKELIIRIQAGYSSLSNVGYPDDPNRREYGEWLESERETLIKMIKEGATLQAIIYPPVGPWMLESGGRRRRCDSLLGFLQTRDDLWDRCEFVVSTEEGPNLLFFGEDILFEGHKTGIEGGYGWTMVYTDKNYLTTRLTIFDMLFQSARRHTLRTYGPDKTSEGDREVLRRAVINAVAMARDGKSPAR
jgi:hypothetical protein